MNPLPQGGQIGFVFARRRRRLVDGPKVTPPARVGSFFVLFAVADQSHRHDAHFAAAARRRPRWECSGCKVAAAVPFWAMICSMTCRASRAAWATSACSSNSSETATLVMPKKAPSIAAATVPEYSTLMPAFSPPLMPLTTRSGRRGQTLEQPQLDAIGRAAFDRPTAPLLPVEQFVDDQRAEIGDRMSDAALLGGRRDDVHLAQRGQLAARAPAIPGRRCRRHWSAKSARIHASSLEARSSVSRRRLHYNRADHETQRFASRSSGKATSPVSGGPAACRRRSNLICRL